MPAAAETPAACLWRGQDALIFNHLSKCPCKWWVHLNSHSIILVLAKTQSHCILHRQQSFHFSTCCYQASLCISSLTITFVATLGFFFFLFVMSLGLWAFALFMGNKAITSAEAPLPWVGGSQKPRRWIMLIDQTWVDQMIPPTYSKDLKPKQVESICKSSPLG